MISKKAVHVFLNRKLREFDWINDLSDREIDRVCDNLGYEFTTQPFRHQKICFLIGVFESKFMFFLDMGLGKTKIILDILNYHRNYSRKARRALIVVPNESIMNTWETENRLHAPDLNIVILNGETKQRRRKIETIDADGFVIHYPGMMHLCTTIAKRKRRIDPEKLLFMKSKFDFIVADESHSIANWSSMQTKCFTAIASSCKFRYGLTGTPFGRDPMRIWAQFKAIDGGETLGNTLGLFREAFFTKHQNYWGGYEYKLRKRREGILHRTLKNRSIRYCIEDCIRMPDRSFISIPIPFPKRNREIYLEHVNKFNSSNRNEKTESFIKIREVLSGFVIHDGKTIRLPQNPKLDTLLELIEDIPEDRKIVVFHEFNYSGQVIEQALKGKDISCVRLYGGTKDKMEVVREFTGGEKYRVLITNSATGGQGINLHIANYQIFYECPVSPIVRTQAENRCYRPNQERKVFVYDLVINNSIDTKILGFVKEGKDLLKAIIDGKETID